MEGRKILLVFINFVNEMIFACREKRTTSARSTVIPRYLQSETGSCMLGRIERYGFEIKMQMVYTLENVRGHTGHVRQQ